MCGIVYFLYVLPSLYLPPSPKEMLVFFKTPTETEPSPDCCFGFAHFSVYSNSSVTVFQLKRTQTCSGIVSFMEKLFLIIILLGPLLLGPIVLYYFLFSLSTSIHLIWTSEQAKLWVFIYSVTFIFNSSCGLLF